jgi:hypothetical protein
MLRPSQSSGLALGMGPLHSDKEADDYRRRRKFLLGMHIVLIRLKEAWYLRTKDGCLYADDGTQLNCRQQQYSHGYTVTRSHQCRGRGANFSRIAHLFGIVLNCVDSFVGDMYSSKVDRICLLEVIPGLENVFCAQCRRGSVDLSMGQKNCPEITE